MSANAFNLDEPENLLFGKRVKTMFTHDCVMVITLSRFCTGRKVFCSGLYWYF